MNIMYFLKKTRSRKCGGANIARWNLEADRLVKSSKVEIAIGTLSHAPRTYRESYIIIINDIYSLQNCH